MELVKTCKAGELIDFLENTKASSAYSLKEVTLSSQNHWKILNGVMSHVSKGFFQVIGLRNRQIPEDEKLMLYQPQSALTGLIICKMEDEIFVLLQARVEPGNTGIIQYGPTIQSTPANYLKLHGGRATAYVENFTSFYPGCHLITHSMQHDLGSKYYQKSKTHHYLLADKMIPTQENMIWASILAIKGVLMKGNFLNADLRSLLAVFDWDGFWRNQHRSLKPLPMPPSDPSKLTQYEMIPLEDLTQWEISDKGVVPRQGHANSIGIYHFAATTREVKAWSQPLYQMEGIGLAQLLYYGSEGKNEFLVRFDHEWGISTESALYPSYLSSPENPNPNPPLKTGKVVSEIIQCDEGGRFHTNDIRYEVRKVEQKIAIDNGFWLEADQLIHYLKASNICSFQMRCISSLLLPLLHPETFGN
ncbi:NDP-hexose 2,3-dehydratase family protein [Algoriphagus namhaensis]|uniref:NDP-hexose 2,3-dehydratase family protein n=1 Tax=Algoriphagus namhaensis TaxID=915353 RepID=A0ABV8AKT8_9BACT